MYVYHCTPSQALWEEGQMPIALSDSEYKLVSVELLLSIIAQMQEIICDLWQERESYRNRYYESSWQPVEDDGDMVPEADRHDRNSR